MNIHYKIVELWPNDHLIVARYWTDVLTEEMLASDSNRREDGTPVRCRSDVSLNLPIPVPTGNDLNEFLMKNAPFVWLKMLEDVRNPDINTDTSPLHAELHVKKSTTLTEVEELFKLPTEVPPNNQDLTESDIQKLIDNLKK
jgi:hypothetical protein